MNSTTAVSNKALRASSSSDGSQAPATKNAKAINTNKCFSYKAKSEAAARHLRDRRFSPDGSAPKMTEEQRERKRLINRLSAQRKRQRERYQLDTLTDQYSKYAHLNSALVADNERLLKLEQKIQSCMPAIQFAVGGMSHVGVMAKIEVLELLRSALVECIEAVEPSREASFAAADPSVAAAAATTEIPKTESPFGATTAFLKEKLKLLDTIKQIILQAAAGQQIPQQQQQQQMLGSFGGSVVHPFAMTTANGPQGTRLAQLLRSGVRGVTATQGVALAPGTPPGLPPPTSAAAMTAAFDANKLQQLIQLLKNHDMQDNNIGAVLALLAGQNLSPHPHQLQQHQAPTPQPSMAHVQLLAQLFQGGGRGQQPTVLVSNSDLQQSIPFFPTNNTPNGAVQQQQSQNQPQPQQQEQQQRQPRPPHTGSMIDAGLLDQLLQQQPVSPPTRQQQQDPAALTVELLLLRALSGQGGISPAMLGQVVQQQQQQLPHNQAQKLFCNQAQEQQQPQRLQQQPVLSAPTTTVATANRMGHQPTLQQQYCLSDLLRQLVRSRANNNMSNQN